MANLDSEWEFTWLSQANVFLQLDDTGSTGTTIHRQTREKKTFKTLEEMQIKEVLPERSNCFLIVSIPF